MKGGNRKQVKILQFADDSTIVVEDEDSLRFVLVMIEIFSKFSGLELNKRKTEAMWAGCWKFRKKETEQLQWKLHPDNNYVKILGVKLSSDKRANQISEIGCFA